nr:GntP family permease [Paenibacillus sp. AR247]
MIAIEAYAADLGMIILYSFLVRIPAAILAGPVFGKFIGKRIRTEPPEELAEQFSIKTESGTARLRHHFVYDPLPVVLMLIGSAADIIDPESTSSISVICKIIGHEVVALLIAAVFSFFSLGFARGFHQRMSRSDRSDHSDHRRWRCIQASSDY